MGKVLPGSAQPQLGKRVVVARGLGVSWRRIAAMRRGDSWGVGPNWGRPPYAPGLRGG